MIRFPRGGPGHVASLGTPNAPEGLTLALGGAFYAGGVVLEVRLGFKLEGAFEEGEGIAVFGVADEGLTVGDEGLALEGVDLGGLFVAVDGLGKHVLVGVVICKLDDCFAVEGVAFDDLVEDHHRGIIIALGAGNLGLLVKEFKILLGAEGKGVVFADVFNEVGGLLEVGGAGEDISGAEEGIDILRLCHLDRAEVGVKGKVGNGVVHVDVAEKGEGGELGFAHAADDFKVLRSAEGLLVADEGVALEEPEVAVVGLVLKEGVKEADGFVVAFGFEEATGEADFPVFLVGLNEDGLAVGCFGGVVFAFGEVTVSEEAVGASVDFTEFEGFGDTGDGVLEVAALNLHEAEVFVGAAEVGVFFDGGFVELFSLLEVALLEVEVGEDEIEGGAAAGLNLRTELGDRGLRAGFDEVDQSAEGFLFLVGNFRLVSDEEGIAADEGFDEFGIFPKFGAGICGGALGVEAGGVECQSEDQKEEAVDRFHAVLGFVEINI